VIYLSLSEESVALQSYWEERDSLNSELAALEVTFFNEVLEGIKPKSIIVFGCGWGREFGFNDKIEWCGVDFSRRNIRVSHDRDREAHVILAAIQNLPLKNECAFDLGLTSHVLMHIPHEDIAIVCENIKSVCKALMLQESINFQEDFHQFNHDYEELLKPMLLKKKIPDPNNPYRHFFLFVKESDVK